VITAAAEERRGRNSEDLAAEVGLHANTILSWCRRYTFTSACATHVRDRLTELPAATACSTVSMPEARPSMMAGSPRKTVSGCSSPQTSTRMPVLSAWTATTASSADRPIVRRFFDLRSRSSAPSATTSQPSQRTAPRTRRHQGQRRALHVVPSDRAGSTSAGRRSPRRAGRPRFGEGDTLFAALVRIRELERLGRRRHGNILSGGAGAASSAPPGTDTTTDNQVRTPTTSVGRDKYNVRSG
jgi:hypothetical protein